MGGLSSYDGTEAKDRNVFAALCEFFCCLRNFAGARDPKYRYLLVGGAVTLQTVDCTGEQFTGYELVEPADHNGVIALAGCYLAFYFFNHSFASPNNLGVATPQARCDLPMNRFWQQIIRLLLPAFQKNHNLSLAKRPCQRRARNLTYAIVRA
jgi:hypothetical protein